ncbi:MAG: putative metal-binding motif-containing protein, partial [Myxococcales bacterium]|nr:putative metal-binding motif-containing protein [Myxococcales bacterium]
PQGSWALEPGDCDDTAPDVHPGAEDAVCDGVDRDCDGVPGSSGPLVERTVDADGDGHFVGTGVSVPCGQGGPATDCDDGRADVFPGAPETCDDPGDRDCDGLAGVDDPACGATRILVPAGVGCGCRAGRAQPSVVGFFARRSWH